MSARAALLPVSGCGRKGPACFVVEAGGLRLMLDLGYGPQPGLWPDVSKVGHVDALLLSHGHADHAGGLKLLPQVGNPPVYATDIVARSLPSHIAARSLPLSGSTEVLGLRVTTGRSGHAPGGIWLHLALGNGLLYMGDNSVESALYAHDLPPPAGTLILDASYGDYDLSLAQCQEALAESFAAPEGLLLPVPENGRGPEIALHLLRSGHPLPRIDGRIRKALQRLATSDAACLRPGVASELSHTAETAPASGEPGGITLASRADGTAGDAAELLARWENRETPAIVFTGYLPPDTPAERLTRSGRARYRRWNVHPRLSDNAALAKAAGARCVLPAFGDAQYLAAWQRAFAPAQVVTAGPVEL
jgi:Cft2 family RNA processing exonuclease